MHRLVIVAIILETIVLSKMCLVLLVTAFKVDFPKISKLLLPYLYCNLVTGPGKSPVTPVTSSSSVALGKLYFIEFSTNKDL